jgi:hypothetical protein
MKANGRVLFGSKELSIKDTLGAEITEAYISFRNIYHMSKQADSELTEFYEKLAYGSNCLGDLQNIAENGIKTSEYEEFSSEFPTEIVDNQHIPDGFPVESDNVYQVKRQAWQVLTSHLSTGRKGFYPSRGETDEPSTESYQDLTLQDLRDMDDYDFEEFVAEAWTRLGWSTTVTQGSADRAIDILAKKHHPFAQKQLIQVKRYAEGNKVTSDQVRKYSTLKNQEENVDMVAIVTASSFTKPASKLAADLNVKTVDGESLLEILNRC